MTRLSLKLGFWSAILMAISLFVYTVSFAILLSFKPPIWINLSNYSASMKETWFVFYTLCQGTAFLTAPLFLLLVNSIHDYAPGDKKVLTRISICFAGIFTVLSSINYFIQFSAVRQSMLKGNLEGLEHFVQLNPASVTFALAMLGWTLFLGLSSFFIAPVFSDGRLEKVIKYSFLINGIFCIIGAIGYVFEILLLSLLYFSVMGMAMIVIAISSGILFRRTEKISN